MKDIAIYGAGGYGREVACLIDTINQRKSQWSFIGFFDDGIEKDSTNEYGKILGGIHELNAYNKDLDIVVAIGNPQVLHRVISQISNPNLQFPNIIAPDVLFYDKKSLSIGKGNIVGFKCVISCNICLGDFNIFNLDVFLGHDTIINSYNIFNPSTRISGKVSIGNKNFFGVGSIVLQQKNIDSETTVGANSTIIKNTKKGNTYFGNPAIIIN